MTYIYRPGTYNVTDAGRARIAQPGFSAATPWWLSGGIAAANCVAAYTPKGAVSLAASYDNNAAPGNGLPDGTYDAALGVAPTWASGTGWTFNGIDQYLTTGVSVSSTAWSAIMRFSGVANAQGGGVGEDATRFYLQPRLVNKRYYANGGFTSVAIDTTSGVMAVAGQQGYYNGIVDGSAISAAPPSGALIRIGLVAGAAKRYLYGNIQAVAIYNATLTAPQVAAVSTAMMAL